MNDNHGGPCSPSVVRMVYALADVQESLGPIAMWENSGPAFRLLDRMKGFADRGMAEQQETFSQVRAVTVLVREVVEILTGDEDASLVGRESLFAAKLAELQSFPDDKIYHGMAKMMTSFQAGLFAGTDVVGFP